MRPWIPEHGFGIAVAQIGITDAYELAGVGQPVVRAETACDPASGTDDDASPLGLKFSDNAGNLSTVHEGGSVTDLREAYPYIFVHPSDRVRLAH